MKYSRLWVLTVIIVCILLVGFVFSVPHTRDNSKALLSENAEPSVLTVVLHDSFKKGLHTITGSLQAPNACATITAQAILLGEASSTQSILVALSVLEDSGVCLQIPTKVDFTTTITAPARLPIRATVNGETATTTVS